MTLRYLTAGESHGPALVGILDGMPAGVEICEEDFTRLMRRRWSGYGRGQRRDIEKDLVEVLSGIVAGKTTGSPISLLIRNQDFDSNKSTMAPFGRTSQRSRIAVPLPGHADFAGAVKFGFDDCRLIRERASARETAMRVALSAPARNLLQALDIRFTCLVESVGGIAAAIDYNQNPEILAAATAENFEEFLTPDASVCDKWKELIDRCASEGKSLGGTAAVIFWNLPVGLGCHTQADLRLDAIIAGLIMSIPAVKSVEIGCFSEPGGQIGAGGDALHYQDGRGFFHSTNSAGGIEGGMTNAEPLLVRFHVKPLPGGTRVESVNLETLAPEFPAFYRSDTQIMPAAALVAESLVAIEIASQLLKMTGGADFDTIAQRYASERIMKKGR
ncbi:MAG: chorismate synthase [Candidatus Riflebacteria bacterium]